MANYNDYQLDEMENAAVNKSKNLKRGLAVGAGVLGAGGATALAADALINADTNDAEELTGDDLMAGAEVVENSAAPVESVTVNHHVNHHVVQHPEVIDDEFVPEPELDVQITETAVLLDEDGNIMSAYDAGKIDGKDFVVIDSDLNGKADILAYDENGNGIYEDHEITQLDNSTYQIGQGDDFKVYAQDPAGNMHIIHEEPNQPFYAENAYDNNSVDGINNDFHDQKDGEFYHNDFADNNPDYNNQGGEQYAGVDDYTYNEVQETPDYGYNDNLDDLAYDTSDPVAFDDPMA